MNTEENVQHLEGAILAVMTLISALARSMQQERREALEIAFAEEAREIEDYYVFRPVPEPRLDGLRTGLSMVAESLALWRDDSPSGSE